MANGVPIKVVVRTEVDGVMLSPNNQIQQYTVKAFNEWDSSVSYFVKN